jgi:hypothetical protein
MEPERLVAIECLEIEGYLAVPRGITPVFSHVVGGRTLAYVRNWTAAKEYDQTLYDLYPLSEAKAYYVTKKDATGEVEEKYHINFGAPTKRATKLNGELEVVD